jgi:hypothetical protein
LEKRRVVCRYRNNSAGYYTIATLIGLKGSVIGPTSLIGVSGAFYRLTGAEEQLYCSRLPAADFDLTAVLVVTSRAGHANFYGPLIIRVPIDGRSIGIIK